MSCSINKEHSSKLKQGRGSKGQMAMMLAMTPALTPLIDKMTPSRVSEKYSRSEVEVERYKDKAVEKRLRKRAKRIINILKSLHTSNEYECINCFELHIYGDHKLNIESVIIFLTRDNELLVDESLRYLLTIENKHEQRVQKLIDEFSNIKEELIV